MMVFNRSRGHRPSKARLPRAIATPLLITLLLGTPAIAPMGRAAVYITSRER